MSTRRKMIKERANNKITAAQMGILRKKDEYTQLLDKDVSLSTEQIQGVLNHLDMEFDVWEYMREKVNQGWRQNVTQ